MLFRKLVLNCIECQWISNSTALFHLCLAMFISKHIQGESVSGSLVNRSPVSPTVTETRLLKINHYSFIQMLVHRKHLDPHQYFGIVIYHLNYISNVKNI